MPAVKPSVVIADEIASLEWDRLIAAMPPGIYTALDTSILAAYALAWSMLVKAQSDLDENGLIERVHLEKDGYLLLKESRINPAAKLWKVAIETLLKTGDRLGLSPGVRSRLQLPNRNDKPTSRFAGLLGATDA